MPEIYSGTAVDSANFVIVDVQKWANGTLGAMANFGTTPGAVLVPGVNVSVFHGTAAPSASNTDFNQISDGTNVMGTMANFGSAPGAVKALNANTATFSSSGTALSATATLFTQLADGTNALGAFANYGTSPGAVKVLGVNAFVTNTVAVNGALTNNNAAPTATLIGVLPAIAETAYNTITYATGDMVLPVTDLHGALNSDLQAVAGTALGATAVVNFGSAPAAVVVPGVNAMGFGIGSTDAAAHAIKTDDSGNQFHLPMSVGTLVQAPVAAAIVTASSTTTLVINATTGDTLFLMTYTTSGSTNTITAVSDSAGNIWSQDLTYSPASNGNMQVWRSSGVIGGSLTITVTLGGATGNAGEVVCAEYTGWFAAPATLTGTGTAATWNTGANASSPSGSQVVLNLAFSYGASGSVTTNNSATPNQSTQAFVARSQPTTNYCFADYQQGIPRMADGTQAAFFKQSSSGVYVVVFANYSATTPYCVRATIPNVVQVSATTASNTAANPIFTRPTDGTTAMGTMANFGTTPGAVTALNANVSLFQGTVAVGSGAPLFTATVPTTSGGCSTAVSQTLTTSASVKGSAGQLYGYGVGNPNAATNVWLFFYNSTSAPTIGSTTNLIYQIMIPGGSAANVAFDNGIAFGTGIQVAVSTSATSAAAPATGLTVSSIYK
jgi:hypothetical protein